VKFIINGGNHDLKNISTYPFKIFGGAWADAPLEPINKGDTIIGNDVWIGNSAVIMSGVKIGNGAVIAAESIVTRDVGDYEIVGGNPARLIRKRFEDKQIEFLLKLTWWDLEISLISEIVSELNSCDIEKLNVKLKKF
jgi:virginiamycin A acetyltransferase